MSPFSAESAPFLNVTMRRPPLSVYAAIIRLHRHFQMKKYMHQTREALTHLSQDEEEMKAKLDSSSAHLQAMKRNQQEMEQKILALKRIRYIKLHPDTVRKIRLHGYYPRNIDMDGKKWKKGTLGANVARIREHSSPHTLAF